MGIGSNEAQNPREGDESSSPKAVSALQEQLHLMLKETAHVESAEDTPSYHDRARAHFHGLSARCEAHAEGEAAEDEAKLFEEMLRYFLEQDRLPKSPGAFQLGDASNAIVREHPQFHARLMAYLISQEEEARRSGNTALLNLCMKAKEGDANRLRRYGRTKINTAKKQADNEMLSEGNEEVSRARAMFGVVLHHWEELQDLPGQGRVHYELGQIAEEEQDYTSALAHHRIGAELYEQLGERVEALIARIKECRCLLYGKQDLPGNILPRIEKLIAEMRVHAADKKTNAREWLGNGLIHLSEVQEAMGDIEAAVRSMEEILSNPDVQTSSIAPQLRQGAERRITLLRTSTK